MLIMSKHISVGGLIIIVIITENRYTTYIMNKYHRLVYTLSAFIEQLSLRTSLELLHLYGSCVTTEAVLLIRYLIF